MTYGINVQLENSHFIEISEHRVEAMSTSAGASVHIDGQFFWPVSDSQLLVYGF